MRIQVKTSEVLDRAADLIEERGWGNVLYKSGGSLCVQHALAEALGVPSVAYHTVNYLPAGNALREYLGLPRWTRADWIAAASTGEGTLWQWNDEWDAKRGPARTAAEVIATLRAAAVIAEARESEAAPQLVSA